MKNYATEEIERLLQGRGFPEEDLLILQPDGSRACAGWELTSGFHLDRLRNRRELNDAELLKSAYRLLKKRTRLFYRE